MATRCAFTPSSMPRRAACLESPDDEQRLHTGATRLEIESRLPLFVIHNYSSAFFEP
jgi:hypothetical protein